MTLDETLFDLSPKAERAVARQYMGRIQWEMILIGVGQSSIWITTLVLQFLGLSRYGLVHHHNALYVHGVSTLS